MPELQGFLIKQNGKCTKCDKDFGPADTAQSTNVTCSRCGETVIVCRQCKDKGCPKCGGKFLDAWDKHPGFIS
jgi:ribosomal protein S27AE